MIDASDYLGRISQSVRTGNGSQAMLLQPLYMSSPDRRSWVPIPEPGTRFPKRGHVFWSEPPAGATEQRLWQFRIAEQTRATVAAAHDRYCAVDVRAVREVVDVREDGDPDAVRRWLTEAGLYLPTPPLPSVYLWTADDLVVGPVGLTRAKGASDCWLWQGGTATQAAAALRATATSVH